MKNIKIETELTVFENVQELPDSIQDLMNKAHQARKRAYAPYSNFMVGAALLLDNGEVVEGNNQENASYPSGLCAERVAAFQAGALYPGVPFKAMAICASNDRLELNRPVPPCGACRQSLVEYELQQQRPFEVYFMGASGPIAMSKSILR